MPFRSVRVDVCGVCVYVCVCVLGALPCGYFDDIWVEGVFRGALEILRCGCVFGLYAPCGF